MGNYSTITEILDVDKDHLISILTEELPVLRAKIGLSQDKLSNIVGISRQTYSAIETISVKCLGIHFSRYYWYLDIMKKQQQCWKCQGHFLLN